MRIGCRLGSQIKKESKRVYRTAAQRRWQLALTTVGVVGARSARSDASMLTLVTMAALRVGRRSASGGVGGAGCQPGGWPRRSVSRHTVRVRRKPRPLVTVDVEVALSALSRLRPCGHTSSVLARPDASEH